MAVNSSPGASSEENQNKVSPVAERDKHQTENEQWNQNQTFSNAQDDQKGERQNNSTDPQLFGEEGAGKE